MRNFKTRVGAASFYVVVFTTTLFTVITMSFIRLMVYETTRTINNDLSNSAYDSALAGVEDAKIALLKYQSCINAGDTTSSECKPVVDAIRAGMENDDCATVAKALGRINITNADDYSAEVLVQEKTDGGANADSVAMEQAYTCVKMYTTVDEYKATLDDKTRVKVIPLRGADGDEDRVRYLNLEWSLSGKNEEMKMERFPAEGNSQAPPIVFDVYQTDDSYSLGELSVANVSMKPDGTIDKYIGTDHFSLVFQPTDLTGTGIEENYVSANDILEKYDSKSPSNGPIGVKCGETNCRVRIELPKTFSGKNERNESTFLARAEILYNEPSVDFAVKMLKGDGGVIPFVDVQAAVDSTGRANDLYRRVEARVELGDTNYPYPEFAVQLINPNDNVTEKNFYMTKNCWHTVEKDGERKIDTCENYHGL